METVCGNAQDTLQERVGIRMLSPELASICMSVKRVAEWQKGNSVEL